MAIYPNYHLYSATEVPNRRFSNLVS